MRHLYVYAAVSGQPRARDVASVPALPNGAAPRIVALDDEIALVVADVPSEVYNADALEAKLTDLDWVSRCGAAHHAVADALVEKHAVIPFRIFTLFSSEAKALATLRKAKPRIARALARVKGRHEWVLRISKPDPARRLAPTARPDKAAAMTGAGFLRAKADARREQTERNRRVAADVASVFETLRGLSDDVATRAIEPGTNLLLDAAFLIPKRRTAPLQKTLTAAAVPLLREGCAVSLTGPWPPYSFAALDTSDQDNG